MLLGSRLLAAMRSARAGTHVAAAGAAAVGIGSLGSLVVAASSCSSGLAGSGTGGSGVVPLAVTGPTQPRHGRPTLVLVHGLDSSRKTWASFIAASAGRYNIIAVDQRGHGDSAMGDEAGYCAAAVVGDIRAALHEHDVGKKVVLLGHSMGGKIAMAYAAAHPDQIEALIIEDMDIRNAMALERAELPAAEIERRRAYDRSFPSWAATKAALASYHDKDGKAVYTESRIDSWVGDGRVYERLDRTWWSGINPLAQWLALRNVLGRVGKAEWSELAAHRFPVTVFVAGRGSACDDASLAEMQALVPRAAFVKFADAGHSIHNADVPEFVEAVEAVYRSIEAGVAE